MRCKFKGYSRLQIQWLDFISSCYNINIQHAMNNGEYKISNSNFKADGYCSETNTIYEFHGDYWHGNPLLYDKEAINTVTNLTFGKLYNKTLKREEFIKTQGYNLVVIWENDWSNLIKSTRTIQRKFREIKKSIVIS